MNLSLARKEYDELSQLWLKFEAVLRSGLLRHVSKMSGVSAVNSRVKGWDSVAAKLGCTKTESASSLTDLFGIRIALSHTYGSKILLRDLNNDILTIKKTTRGRNKNFDRDPSWFSRILICEIRPDFFEQDENSRFEPLKGRVFEIQIRSLFTQILTEQLHERAYGANVRDQMDARSGVAEKLNGLDRAITEFESLVDDRDVHEKSDIHPFILRHRFLLHTSASEIISEAPIGLGTEFRIDFLIREPDGSYILVEIENPNCAIVTKRGDISAPVNHAIQQVEDWQEWIAENLGAVQHRHDGISSPRGLVIIGRSKSLSGSQRRKLARRNLNFAGRISVITYDELIANARAYVSSLRQTIAQ